MKSVPRRLRLASQALSRWYRELPRSFGPFPIGNDAFVAMMTLSRRPATALPIISSDIPPEYTSAVSNMLTPASRQMSTSRVASLTSVSPHARKKSLLPPNVPVPKLSTGTLKPDWPSRRNSTSPPERTIIEVCEPRAARRERGARSEQRVCYTRTRAREPDDSSNPPAAAEVGGRQALAGADRRGSVEESFTPPTRGTLLRRVGDGTRPQCRARAAQRRQPTPDQLLPLDRLWSAALDPDEERRAAAL